MMPLALLIQYLFAKLLNIEYANTLYIIICVIIAFAALFVYYKYTRNKKWFESKGAYWVENGIVYIEKQNKIYKIEDVKWLRGTTVSVYGFDKSGMLVVQFKNSKIILVSSSTVHVNDFSDSELLPLFETILQYNTELKKDDTLDFWYEFKK